MKNLLLQKRAEHQNHNSSLEYNHQKARDKSQEKEKDYLQSKQLFHIIPLLAPQANYALLLVADCYFHNA